MGKLGCRLYCWGCGGCCLITGIVMGILSVTIPSGMLATCQENAFDFMYIDGTTETEAEGLFADAGLPVAESDAFKAWGKSVFEGYGDCMKADFPFEWGKVADDCLNLYFAWFLYNTTNAGAFAEGKKQEVQEIGPWWTKTDSRKIDADTGYWESTGKQRNRKYDHMASSTAKCDDACMKIPESQIFWANYWYVIYADAGIVDGWGMASALTNHLSENTSTTSTVDAYLKSTPAVVAARMIDLFMFLITPDASNLGSIGIPDSAESQKTLTFLKAHLLNTYEKIAPMYGVPAAASPLFVKTTPSQALGWGEQPYYIDWLSMDVFTFAFMGNITPPGGFGTGEGYYDVYKGSVEAAYMECKTSSIYYHEGLSFFTQHYVAATGPTYNSSCATDADCPPAACYKTQNCNPAPAAEVAGGVIPGFYFGSPKGQGPVAAFPIIWATYFVFGQLVPPAAPSVKHIEYKGPDTSEGWDFEGYLRWNMYKTSHWVRRLENCNYPGGLDLGDGLKDSVGHDCNQIHDSINLKFFVGFTLYFTVFFRDADPPGYDASLNNLQAGSESVRVQDQCVLTPCYGNSFCDSPDASQYEPFSFGYEPHLGAAIDATLGVGAHTSIFVSAMHPELSKKGRQTIFGLALVFPIHLPTAIGMDMVGLQTIPSAFNGLYFLLVGQSLTSLIGGMVCCLCGA